jgi:hypothetical protein
MKKLLIVTLFWAMPCALLGQTANFYGRGIDLGGWPAIDAPAQPIRANDREVSAMLARLERADWASLLARVDKLSSQLRLNEWYRYQLLLAIAGGMLPQRPNEQAVFVGFCLAKRGYDVRFKYRLRKIALYIYSGLSPENVIFFGYTLKNKRFWSLHNMIEYGPARNSQVRLNSNGRPFPADIAPLPALPGPAALRAWRWGEPHLKVLRFYVDSLSAQLGIHHFNNDYVARVGVPLSDTARQTLIGPLKELCKKYDQTGAVRFLLSLVRKNIIYKDDEIEDYIDGASVNNTPEATLWSGSGNCVDSASIFSYLVREVLGLPVILVLYRTHLTTAVAVEGIGHDEPIVYGGKRYYVCETTNGSDTREIGSRIPNLGEFQILELGNKLN